MLRNAAIFLDVVSQSIFSPIIGGPRPWGILGITSPSGTPDNGRNKEVETPRSCFFRIVPWYVCAKLQILTPGIGMNICAFLRWSELARHNPDYLILAWKRLWTLKQPYSIISVSSYATKPWTYTPWTTPECRQLCVLLWGSLCQFPGSRCEDPRKAVKNGEMIQ